MFQMTGDHSTVEVDSGAVVVEPLRKVLIPEIYQNIEKPNWAPWLRASEEDMERRIDNFPAGQLVIAENGEPVACLFTNRVNWENYPDPNGLPDSWDYCGGKKEGISLEEAYEPKGNSLFLLAINVKPGVKGLQLPRRLINAAQEVAQREGIPHIISTFRPNGFGMDKLKRIKEGQEALSFEDYCRSEKNGAPIDGWLRNVTRNGARLITECKSAMRVKVPIDTFKEYKSTYNPDLWLETSPGTWECGETGTWKVFPKNGLAFYQEPNYWGEVKSG